MGVRGLQLGASALIAVSLGLIVSGLAQDRAWVWGLGLIAVAVAMALSLATRWARDGTG